MMYHTGEGVITNIDNSTLAREITRAEIISPYESTTRVMPIVLGALALAAVAQHIVRKS